MEKIQLAEEIIKFCAQYRFFSNTENMKAENIVQQLENDWFVEQLIHTLITKATFKRNIDNKKLKELLLELEQIRLDLEFED